MATLIDAFRDTLDLSMSERFRDKTQKAIASNVVFEPGFTSKKHGKRVQGSIPAIVATTTFAAARSCVGQGRIAVLNFANAYDPGGGVELGAVAQEECLCRSSNLYPCLTADNVWQDYYMHHRRLNCGIASDRLIYTKDVTVFKDDRLIPGLLPEELCFQVDVITCAAPYLSKAERTNPAVVKPVFKSRIHNILEAAIENDVDIVVLGAFGCGAFKNPPETVAEAFHAVLNENAYIEAFKQIIFAIKPTGGDADNCPNIRAFTEVFRSR